MTSSHIVPAGAPQLRLVGKPQTCWRSRRVTSRPGVAASLLFAGAARLGPSEKRPLWRRGYDVSVIVRFDDGVIGALTDDDVAVLHTLAL